MIDPTAKLSVSRQAIAGSAGAAYYKPPPRATARRHHSPPRRPQPRRSATQIEALSGKPNTSKPALGHKICPYLLRKLPVTRPNQVWAMDITHIPMARGFIYLAAVLDWFTRRVLAWRVLITLDQQ